MARGACAVALLCALVVAGGAAYTVDCNHEYTDCDHELSKLTNEDDDPTAVLPSIAPAIVEVTTTRTTSTSTVFPTRSTPAVKEVSYENKTEELFTTEANEIIERSTKPKARLLNLSIDDLQNFANALHNQTKGTKKLLGDLSDVNLDGDDEDEPPKMITHEPKNKQISDKFYTNLQAPFNTLLTDDRSEEIETCKENGVMYKIGEHIDRGCDESCECVTGGNFDCSPRCNHPYILRGRRLEDPLCFESPVDMCCSIVTCATGNGDTKPTSLEVCRYGNDSHVVGAKWNIGCEQTCTCEPNSIVTCKPRCERLRHSEKCINVQDPNDECCEVQVCDVSQDVHEEPADNMTSSTSTTTAMPLELHDLIFSPLSTMRPLVLVEPIGSIKVLQNNSVQVNLMHMNNSDDPIHLLLSRDGGKTYSDVELKYSNLILNLEGGNNYILKTKETGTNFNFTITAMDNGNEVSVGEGFNETKIGCSYDGRFYAVGEEFKIQCSEVCECTGHDTHECAPLVCPSHVGLELVSRSCVEWEQGPPPQPPNCCPRTARCLSDGTCHYKEHYIPNWSEVPLSVSGCELRCFCENGVVDCQEACNPLPSLPPQSLRCSPMHRPAPVNISDEDCCKQWGCVPHVQMASKRPPPSFLPTVPPENQYPQEDIPDYDQNNIHRPDYQIPFGTSGLPIGFPVPGFDNENKKLSVLSLQGDSPTSIKMLFGLASVLVGLRGSIDLRYTDTADEDVSQWNSQVFAPADEILTTPRLEFRLTGLKPSTTYKIKGKLNLHNLKMEPESDIYTVRTQDLTTILPLEEKRREIDAKLTVLEVNDTTAQISWRHFSEDELQLIDGIQVRYRPTGTPIYSMTELLHHSRSHAELRELRPGSHYEAALVLIPPPKGTTELIDSRKVEFTTAPSIDPYNWSITLVAHTVGSEAAELVWRGVPEPAERWVRVYRAAHACAASSKEHDALKLAARDSPSTITVTGLEPNSKCRIWLELFLTNGKVKTSNVLEIHTKSLDSAEPIDNVVEASSVAGLHKGDYYGALVVVGVIAALAALTTILLLLVVVRRHRPRSVPITSVPSAPRESSLPPYDNPAYKLELQQETMDL